MYGSLAAGVGGVGVIQFLTTNNEAEYDAVLIGLRIAKSLGVRNLKLNLDSKLVVGQITKEYEAKEDRMKRYLKLTNQLVSNFDDVRITQVPKEENSKVDEVARLASSNSNEGRLGLYMEVQSLPGIEGLDVNYV